MLLPPRFLLVDADEDSRDLLRWTLQRLYPKSVLSVTTSIDDAVELVRAEPPDIVLVHRASDAPGVAAVRALRKHVPDLPLVMLSAVDQSSEAAAAGATAFLRRDEWLQIRGVLDRLLAGRQDDQASAASPS